jgi:glyoxylase-like metal-dependent hydrolase (beta-lactamase superfamily II)
MRLIDRRTVLTGAAAAASSALAPSLSTSPVNAAAPLSGKQAPSFYRHKVGEFEITVLSDGIFQNKLERSPARNASLEEVQAALSASFMPPDQSVFHFNQNVVNTGSKLVLIDTGNFPGRPGTGLTLSNLTASGIDPKAVDVVIISHFHQDHIGGLRTANGDLIYPNAEIMVPAVEWAHWMDDAKMNAAPENARGGFQNVRKIFGPIADKVTKYEWGKELVPGITALATPGHTPGHTSFVISSGSAKTIVQSDATPGMSWLFIARTDWLANGDTDAPLAQQTRRKLFDMIATDRILFGAYHMPFPGLGYLEKAGDGYRFVPSPWNPIV